MSFSAKIYNAKKLLFFALKTRSSAVAERPGDASCH